MPATTPEIAAVPTAASQRHGSGDDWRALYPFASHYLPLEAGRLHYLDQGRGETLLLLHGNPTWSFYWRNVVLALRERYRLIVPDHLGCGLSDKPAAFSYRLADHVANVTRLIEALDLQRITLVAHDWGGAIGMGAAAALPERFSRFVLCNTAAFRSTRIPWRIRVCRTPLLGKLAVQGANAFARAAQWMATQYPQRLAGAVRAGYLAPYDSWSNRIATHRFVLDIPLKARHPSYQTLAGIEEGLAQFREHPVLLIWGMRDWCFTPEFLQRFIEFFPAAEVRRADDAGHYVIEDAADRMVPWIEGFLAQHPLAGA